MQTDAVGYGEPLPVSEQGHGILSTSHSRPIWLAEGLEGFEARVATRDVMWSTSGETGDMNKAW